ncbi:transmembrane protein 266 [Plakobranchus ocellatus]|uniref:Transmembrane protein 266 n=1 Tax=Plakobranchus ocellatus TaxID=259542 RepID=A0AAV4DQ30_9GAST|nr:transmembrane protein 266 [Plakobranchus ocellatus]
MTTSAKENGPTLQPPEDSAAEKRSLPQQGELILSGPPQGTGACSGARTHERSVHAFLRKVGEDDDDGDDNKDDDDDDNDDNAGDGDEDDDDNAAAAADDDDDDEDDINVDYDNFFLYRVFRGLWWHIPKHGSHYTFVSQSNSISNNISVSSTNRSDSTVSSYTGVAGHNSSDQQIAQINTRVMDILDSVFHFTSLGIAAIFCAEIIFKISFLGRELISQPWQIFDIVIVALTLGVELTCHYIDLPWKGLYSLKYIVLARLWRIPFVCNMKALRVKESMEKDMEVHRNGRQKAEEKCTSLELTLSQHAEIIRQLKGTLQTFTTERDIERESITNRSMKSLTSSPLLKRNTPVATQLRRSLLRKSKKKEPSNVMETEFLSRNSVSRGQKQVSGSYNVANTVASSAMPNAVSDATDAATAYAQEESVVLGTEGVYQLQQHSLHNTRNNSMKTRLAAPRRKTRRSSTSEYIDYAKLTSVSEKRLLNESEEIPNDIIFNSHSSEPILSQGKTAKCLPSSHSNSSASDASSPSDIPGRSAQQELETWSSGGLSEDSSLNGDAGDGGEKSHRHRGRKIRRFSSCPEYAFTQRVTMTSDESALIDDRSSGDLSIHDNLGFVITDEEGLHVLAEFDGTRTYRSEEGIPMTSL